MRLTSIFLVFTTVITAHDLSQGLPTTDEVVAKMMERDNRRQAAFRGYTGVRRYILENQPHHKRAEMFVKVNCLDNGTKQFETVSATGWGAARKHVFPRLLESESEASLPDAREKSRITPENYSFEMVGKDYVNGRPAYVMTIAPKKQNKYLIQGKIWVDLDDWTIVRIEGNAAKSPSFWIKSVHFVHSYQKNGSFWFPASDRSVTDVRILGATEVTIEYFDYSPNTTALSAYDLVPGGLR